jgi:hypothetical protein
MRVAAFPGLNATAEKEEEGLTLQFYWLIDAAHDAAWFTTNAT